MPARLKKSPLGPRPAARSAKADSGTARERLLDAAAVVFARDGLAGSTTREIAYAAGVNEVTLFRLFQTKQNLLTAVLERLFATSGQVPAAPAVETDLREIVRDYVTRYDGGIHKNLALRRVLIGEIQHFQEHELKVIRAIFEPARQHLIGRLRGAQAAGLARKEIDPAIIADQIGALVFMGALKSSLPVCREYSTRDYTAACVETIVRAIETRAPVGARKRSKP
jgi:AcrR family transcriptional regulator